MGKRNVAHTRSVFIPWKNSEWSQGQQGNIKFPSITCFKKLSCSQRKILSCDATCFVHPLTSRRFQVCLTLFSEYFAMFPHGTYLLSNSSEIFSFWWKLPPFITLISKSETRIQRTISRAKWNRDSHPETCLFPKQLSISTTAGTMHEHYNSMVNHWFSIWALPSSLAATKGIQVCFFSSA